MEKNSRCLLSKHRRLLIICFASVFIWGLFAHTYAYTNFQFNHDSLDGLYAAGAENAHKIELGRVFVPAYRTLVHGVFAAPWLTGCLALLWTALGMFLIIRIFDADSAPTLWLIGGVLAVNLTFICLSATFLHDLDADLFAMLLACAAAWLWTKRPRGWFVLGVLSCAVSMGLYQSYISVTITLVMMHLLLAVLQGENVSSVIRRGLWAVAMVALGGVLYLLSVKAITAWSGIVVVERKNSISALGLLTPAAIPNLIGGTYRDWFGALIHTPLMWLAPWAGAALNVLVLALTALMIIRRLFSRELTAGQKVLAAVIALAMPLGMNTCYVLTSGEVHDLMRYASVLLYVLALLLCLRSGIKWTNVLAGVLVFLLTFSGVQTANTAYLQKSTVTSATYARMVNVLYDMMFYGYVPGETPLYVHGAIPMEPLEAYARSDMMEGMDIYNAITRDVKSIRAYFTHVLGDNVVWCTNEQREQIRSDPAFEGMPVYPADGYIETFDEVLVVKFGP